jgi:hypothetical protein
MTAWEFDENGLTLLESALVCLDRAEAARAVVEREGLTVTDRHGCLRPHPAVAIERDFRGLFLRKVKSLGLDLEPLHSRPGRPAGR